MESIAQKSLSLKLLRLGLYQTCGPYPGDLGTQPAVTGCEADGYGAYSEHSQHTAPGVTRVLANTEIS